MTTNNELLNKWFKVSYISHMKPYMKLLSFTKWYVADIHVFCIEVSSIENKEQESAAVLEALWGCN